MKGNVNIVNIIIMFVVLAILASIVYRLFGVQVQEGFLFSAPDKCGRICQGVGAQARQYCNSEYLKEGPAALCNCRWDSQTRTCNGTRAADARCSL